jgi:hypothetical protein
LVASSVMRPLSGLACTEKSAAAKDSGGFGVS